MHTREVTDADYLTSADANTFVDLKVNTSKVEKEKPEYGYGIRYKIL